MCAHAEIDRPVFLQPRPARRAVAAGIRAAMPNAMGKRSNDRGGKLVAHNRPSVGNWHVSMSQALAIHRQPRENGPSGRVDRRARSGGTLPLKAASASEPLTGATEILRESGLIPPARIAPVIRLSGVTAAMPRNLRHNFMRTGV